ncbi:erythromycin esterase family protein [Anditalea andensis]|uniref:Erythromycin esterase n=1 Tax=Anditalea andensis TaxID=1048983 RepID=A0A074KZP6_9BACT|nr:erythromycin esterase family protein [Anditalea andensis]KEO74404.1 hypothetical protein EL17_06620 [Anditalea andensis]
MVKRIFALLIYVQILACSPTEKNPMIIQENFENLSILDQWVHDKEIIFLGEPTHGDGTIFTARIKIIKYLVEMHGFDAVIFESNGYDAYHINELRRRGEIDKKHFGQSTFSIWGHTLELQELWQFLMDNNNVKFLGMDHYPHTVMKEHFLNELKNAVNLTKAEEQLLQSMIDSIATTELLPRRYYLSPHESAKLDLLKNKLKHTKKSIYLKEGIDNLMQYAAFESLPHLHEGFWTKFNYRDSLMFESIKSHANNNKKVVVWLASAHALESPSNIVDPDDLKEIGQTYADMVTLGNLAKSHFGDKMLNLAFSAYEGGFYDFVDKKEINFKLDSIPNLEMNVYEKNQAITIVDLRKIDSVYFSGILGFELIQANWGKNFDGVIVFPQVKASRRVQ